MVEHNPEHLTMEEVVELARRAGIKDTERKTKKQLLRAIGLGKPESPHAPTAMHPRRWAPMGEDDPKKWKDVPGGEP